MCINITVEPVYITFGNGNGTTNDQDRIKRIHFMNSI